jgi:hypothetical protein
MEVQICYVRSYFGNGEASLPFPMLTDQQYFGFNSVPLA